MGLIDRLFFPANRFGIPLPLAIILFLVDIVVSLENKILLKAFSFHLCFWISKYISLLQISAGFLLFPKTYQVDASSRKKRSDDTDDSSVWHHMRQMSVNPCSNNSQLCHIIMNIISSEVASLTFLIIYIIMNNNIKHRIVLMLPDARWPSYQNLLSFQSWLVCSAPSYQIMSE